MVTRVYYIQLMVCNNSHTVLITLSPAFHPAYASFPSVAMKSSLDGARTELDSFIPRHSYFPLLGTVSDQKIGQSATSRSHAGGGDPQLGSMPQLGLAQREELRTLLRITYSFLDIYMPKMQVRPRAHRATEGSERACNLQHRDIKMLSVTKYSCQNYFWSGI